MAVLTYIAAALYILGCFTIPIGIFLIIVGMKLWGAANKLEQLKYQDNPDILYAALEDLGSYFTWSGILLIVSIILGVLAAIVYTLVLLPTVSTMYSL